jgi:pilus assembly protein CpaE
MMPLSAALLIATRPLQEQTNACIQNLPVRIALETGEFGEPDDLLDRIDRHRVDVVLIEAGKLDIPLDEFVRRLRETPSQPAVFVLHTEAAPQLILETLRAGANEFLCPPLAEPLRDAFERLSVVRQKQSIDSPGGLGHIFGFLSVKGGCGATTFAAHVSTAVAASLKSQSLLADFDFDAGLLRFIMKSRSTWSVRDALDNMHRMDSNYWKKLISTHGEFLDILPAPDELAARIPAGAQETAHLMRFIRSTYRATIVDFGRHYSSSALDSFPELDTLYLVATTDLETLDHARDCIAFLQSRAYPLARVKVLLNRVPERSAPDPKGIESYLGLPFSEAFCSDEEALYDAWSEGRLLNAGSKLGCEMNRLSSAIAARVRGEDLRPVVPAAPAQGRFGKLLSLLTKGAA